MRPARGTRTPIPPLREELILARSLDFGQSSALRRCGSPSDSKFHRKASCALILRRLISDLGYTYYKHQTKESACGCEIPAVPAKDLEVVVLRELKKLAKRPDVVRDLVKKAQDTLKAKQPDYRDALQSLRRRTDGVARKMNLVTDQILEAQSESEKGTWKDKLRQLQSEKTHLEREQLEMESQLSVVKDQEIDEGRILEALEQFSESFDELPVAARQLFIHSLVGKVELEETRLTIWLKGLDFEGVGCKPQVDNLVYPQNWLAG